MATQNVSHLLGTLQHDPENADALAALAALVENGAADQIDPDSLALLDRARAVHDQRAEYRAVAQLLEVLSRLTEHDPDRAAALLTELGRVYREELLDDQRAVAAYQRALQLRPGDDRIQEAIEQIAQTAAKWDDIASRFIEEAEQASDPTLKSSLLVSAGSLIWKYKKRGRDKQVDSLFKAALGAADADTRAARLYEQILRARGKWAELATVLLEAAERARGKAERALLFLRAARVLKNTVGDRERAAACYERVLDVSPGDTEAMAFLVEHFTEQEKWDHLVALYEDALRSRTKLEDEAGALLQLGMVHWRFREKPAEAEPYFARLRKMDPAHPGMLDFYREHLQGADEQRWVTILTDAQRAAQTEEQKLQLAIELAKAAQASSTSTDRAIDAWKAVLRIDPTHPEAPEALKALYEKTEKWNALVEVLKGEVDRVPADRPERKVALLRHLIPIYRDKLGLDVMVINTYNAILQHDPADREALEALATTYETTGRWNDLIGVLTRKADALDDPEEKVALYMRVANLWIERFANYNQATEPLEKAVAVDPNQREALASLKEIYKKKRAWKPLFDVLSKEAELASDPNARLELNLELARLAGERLHKHAEAIALWRAVLEHDAANAEAMEQLEKLAEREKDWPTLADVTERRLNETDDDKTKLKLLGKLGVIYGEHMQDVAMAASAWKRILGIEPKNGRALRTLRETFLASSDWDGLESLYGDAGDWDGLVDVLGNAAERATDEAVKVDLSFRAARVFVERLNQPHRAFRSYERVLATDPKNERAARALIPIYEREEKWNRLPALYEILLSNTEPEEQLEILNRLRRLSVERMSDAAGAYGYAARAFQLAPTDDAVRQALEDETARAGKHESVMDLYLSRLDQLGDEEGDERMWLRRRVAFIAGEELGQPELAIEQLRAILVAQPDDVEAAAKLETIYRASNRSRDLRGLLLHRISHADGDEARKALLAELAKLEEETLSDPDSASARHRQILEIDPSDRTALAALDRLSAAGQRWQELADVIRRRRELAETDEARNELTLRLGDVLATALEDAPGALEAFGEVVRAKPESGRAIAGLELVQELAPNLAGEASLLLETAYEATGAWEKLALLLERRMNATQDAGEKRTLRLRFAEVSARKGSDTGSGYKALEDAFLDDPADPELQDRLIAAAEQGDKHEELAAAFATAMEAGALGPLDAAQLAAKLANLYDVVLARPEAAEPFHKKVLAHDPSEERSFAALKDLYTNAERWDDLQGLYRERIAQTLEREARLDLLMQVCFLFEELIDDPEQAIKAYQDVLELEPEDQASRHALERLFERTERWRDLVVLLRAELDRANPDEQVGLTQRLGMLHEKKLGEPQIAVDHYEQVLSIEPNHKHAREALERLIANPAQRQRIAKILEPIYEERADWAELVSVLEVQLEEISDPAEKLALLARIADLQENRLHDPGAAFGSVARAVQIDPSEAQAREELARLARMRDAERERAKVLESAISTSQTPSLTCELLLELSQLWDERVGDVEEAEQAYKRLIEAQPEDPEVLLAAARALERIHLGKGDHAALAEDLRRQVALEQNNDDRARLLVRLADLLEEVLEDKDGAIAAHRERLELDPGDVEAMRALERLYEEQGLHEPLIEILRMHDGATSDADEQREIAQQIGGIYEDQLGDRESAINAYSDALARFGRDAETLEALTRLYQQAERWADLLEIGEMVFEEAQESSARAAVRFSMAETMRLRTRELERAVELYAEVLDLAPDHEGALKSLALVMSTEAPAPVVEGEEAQQAPEPLPLSVRIAAARVLLPRYEATADYEQLLLALSVLAESDDTSERYASLRRAAEVADAGLEDPSRAFALQARAVRAGLSEDDLADLLRDLSRLAEQSGQWQDYVNLLGEIAPDIMDADLAVEVLGRVAQVAQTQLNDTALARQYYERVLEQRPDDAGALDALEDLTAGAEDYAALLDVLRRKTDLAESSADRVALLLRRAEISEKKLGDAQAAVESYDQALGEESKPREAYDGLERLYFRGERWSDLASHYERMLEDGVGEPVEIRYRLGAVQLENLNDAWNATEQFREAINLDNRHEKTIAALEKLMQNEELRGTAAEILEPVFLQQMKWPKVKECLEARIAANADVEERKAHLTRLGQIHEDYLEDLDGALESYARLFREDPRDESAWDTLTRLARVLEKHGRLAEIYEQALTEISVDDESTAKLATITGQLHETKTGDLDAAARMYERALRFEPTDHGAFESLERVHQQRKAWDALLELYREQAQIAEDDQDRIALVRKSARLLEEHVSQPERAIEMYREILNIDREDPNAIAALDDLLLGQQRWTDIADHLRHQIELAAGQPEENDLKFRLATVLEEKLEDQHGAIDVYEEITQADPHHADTVAALEALVQVQEHQSRIIQILEPIYQATDQWRKRIAVYEAQVAMTEEVYDKVRLLQQIAELHETRSGDLALAFHAQARALGVDPDNEEIRGEVDRFAAQLGTWDALITAYETAFAASTDASSKASLLGTMARVHDEKRGDPRAAIETYERLLEIDPEDTTTLDALEALHTMVGDWRGMTDVLSRKVQRAFDPVERGELLRRAGSVFEELLGDPKAAVESYKSALAEDEQDVIALESLDRLYEAAQDWDSLADILKRRIELEQDAPLRVELGLRMGQLCEEQLRRPDDAIEAFQRVLDDEAEQPTAIEALARLYEKQSRWPELLDNLRLRAGSSPEPERRVALLFRAGEVLEREMDDVPSALATHEEVLAIDPRYEPAIQALVRISKLEDYRVQASEILEPLLRREQRWDELAELLAAKAQAAFDPVDKKDELRRLAEVHEQGRGDREAAFEAYRKALGEDPSDEESANDVERLAGELGAWEKAADAFAGRASSVTDPEVARALYGRLARIAEVHLNDDARAIEAYSRAIEQAGDDPDALGALDRLYTKGQAWKELSEILDRRIQSASDEERSELLVRAGTLKHEHFKDLRGAFRAFSEVLERDPREARAVSAMEALLEHDELAPEVVEVLEPVYRQTGANEQVAALFDVRIQLAETDGERVRFLQEQAAHFENELGDPTRALEALKRAFELDPRDENQLGDLERLAPLAGGYESLRGLVEKVVENPDMDRSLARDLHMRAASWYGEHLRDATAAEARLRDAIKADPDTKEAHVALVDLLRQPGRERDLVAALMHWAEVDFDEEEKKSRLREAAALAESALGDGKLAITALEKILEADGADSGALAELCRLETAAGNHAKVAQLILRRIDVEMDPGARVGLRKELARAHEGLGQTKEAIEAWRGALDEEATDLESIEALESLYEKTRKWSELEELIQRRLDIAETPKDRIAARVRLARLADQQLGRRAEAIDQLREILGEDPGNPEAQDELERLYEADKKWPELVELLEGRASGTNDAAEERDILVRLAKVHAEQLNDADRAVEIYGRVLAKEPSNLEVLRALVELNTKRKDWAAAVDGLERIGNLQQGPEAIATAFKMAEMAETSLQDPARAEQALRRAYGLDPGSKAARDALKAHYTKHKQSDRLAEMLVLDEKDEEDPKKKIELLKKIAELYAKDMNNPGAAAPYLERASKLAPEDRDVLLPLCDLYIASGRQKEAVPVLEQIIASYGARRNKEVAIYHHRLGKAKESMGDVDGAMESYDAAFKVDLTNVRVLTDLGRLCVTRGDFDRAQKTFRALLLQKLGPNDGVTKADVYFYLGDISVKQGDPKKAISMIERALAEDSKHAQAAALMAQLKG
jgi:tetratricopeptide (TPR) repeat protein